MKTGQWFPLAFSVLWAILLCPPAALAQPVPDRSVQAKPWVPDFSGLWHRWLRPGLGPPESGPGPVTNRVRLNGVSNYNRLVGDYENPILTPQAAAIVKRFGELSLSGVGYPTPSNQCWPSGVPYVFWNFGMQMFQKPGAITIIYLHDHECAACA